MNPELSLNRNSLFHSFIPLLYLESTNLERKKMFVFEKNTS